MCVVPISAVYVKVSKSQYYTCINTLLHTNNETLVSTECVYITFVCIFSEDDEILT